MATPGAQKRLAKEYKSLSEEPIPYIYARPDEADILEWHYIITGPPDTPYDEGQYHGMLIFPSTYPFKPPGIKMITPNGRFQPNMKLCLTISDFHPEQWNPAWSVGTILNGLLSFMTGNEMTSGSIRTTDKVKKDFAKQSKDWNSTQNKSFMRVLPDFIYKNGKLVTSESGPRAVEQIRQLKKREELKRKLDDLKKSDTIIRIKNKSSTTSIDTPSNTSGTSSNTDGDNNNREDSPCLAIETVEIRTLPQKKPRSSGSDEMIDLLPDGEDSGSETDDDFYGDFEPFDSEDSGNDSDVVEVVGECSERKEKTKSTGDNEKEAIVLD
jgi:ubiquitin-conjugating enzyme E2 J2